MVWVLFMVTDVNVWLFPPGLDFLGGPPLPTGGGPGLVCFTNNGRTFSKS